MRTDQDKEDTVRIAVLYDIHGNLPALEAVLRDIEKESVDQLVIGGDVVPGPMSGESLSRLLELSMPARFIRGNGERAVLAAHHGEELTDVPERVHESIRWVADELSAEQLEVMATWPLTEQLTTAPFGEILFCHATPRDDNEIFTRATPEGRLRPIFGSAKASVVVCGHTHMQFDRHVGPVRVINAGSVGMPFGAPGAYWLLMTEALTLRRTPYDLAAAEKRLRASGFPGADDYSVSCPPTETQMIGAFEVHAVP